MMLKTISFVISIIALILSSVALGIAIGGKTRK